MNEIPGPLILVATLNATAASHGRAVHWEGVVDAQGGTWQEQGFWK
jgi:hypothetical protein